MNKVHFNKDRCKGCGMCVLFCPHEVLCMSDELNDQGFSMPEVIDQEGCTACGVCFRMCPDCAIRVDKKDAKKTEQKPEATAQR